MRGSFPRTFPVIKMKHLLLLGVLVGAQSAPLAAQTDLGPLNLPSSFASIPYDDDFEAHAGVIPSHMAVTAIDSVTLLPDAEAWANIGQNAACLMPFSGSYNLELGMIPGTTNYHNVRNALVVGLDATGYGGAMDMSCRVIDGGEEANAVDGVWVSNDGSSWYAVATTWGVLVGPTNTWEKLRDLALDSTPVDVTAQFYLAIVQEDNFPYLDLDGVGIDDIHLPQVAFEPILAATDLIGGAYGTVTISEAPTTGSGYYLSSFSGLGSDPIGGLTTGLSAPIFNFATLPLDILGQTVLTKLVPATLSGRTVYLQGVALGGGGAYLTNTVTELVD